MHYTKQCTNELLSITPKHLPKTRINNHTRVANLYSLHHSIKTHTLYQHTTLRDHHTLSYLTKLADNNAKIRFAPTIPNRSLIVDHKITLLPIPSNKPKRQNLAVMHKPNVIA